MKKYYVKVVKQVGQSVKEKEAVISIISITDLVRLLGAYGWIIEDIVEVNKENAKEIKRIVLGETKEATVL